ncbi:protein kinase [Streptomyces albidoflavus]
MQVTPLSPEDPTELGGFDLLGRIGQGGMGQVYLGESPSGEPAAVKVIKSSVVDSESRQRFAQEIEILKTIWGPRIAAFLDSDAEAERPWLATEYVEGPDLRKHVASYGPLPAVLAASLGAILAEALTGVHKQGLLHRDLKPANVLLGPNGPKIIDFGLAVFAESNASLTAPNQVVGTPACMAPEQAAGVKPLTGAVDVYALGAVLLFAVSGRYPYQAPNVVMAFHMVTDPSTSPDLTGVPDEFSPLLAAMLAQDAAARPALPEVVARCRAVIEAAGLKVAQARRRLTTFAAPQDQTATAELQPAATLALADLRTVTATAAQAPVGGDPGQALTVAQASPLPAAHDAADVTDHAPTLVDTPPSGQPTATTAAPRRRSGKPAARSLRQSVQARRTAEQLRMAYASSASF